MKALELLKSFDVKDRGERHGGRYEFKVEALYCIAQDGVFVLDYFFSDAKDRPAGFHGCTGYLMVPVTQQQIDERLQYPDEEMWRMAVQEGRTTNGLNDWWKEICEEADEVGLLYPWDDSSFREDFEYILENAGESEKEAIKENVIDPIEDYGGKVVAWSCQSVGRNIPTADEDICYLFNSDLMRLVKLFEKD